jgi:four helix bundle protein
MVVKKLSTIVLPFQFRPINGKKNSMKNKESEIIYQRSKDLSLRILRMAGHIRESFVSDYILEQLIRASARICINYKSSCNAATNPESLEKLDLAREKTINVIFWLELIEGCEMVKADRLVGLKQEVEALFEIFNDGLKTSKRGVRKKE